MTLLNKTGCHSGGAVHPNFLTGQESIQQFKSTGSADDEVRCRLMRIKNVRPWQFTPTAFKAPWPFVTLQQWWNVTKHTRTLSIFNSMHRYPFTPLHLFDTFSYFTDVFHTLLCSENHVSTDVLMMNGCDKLKDGVFLLSVEKFLLLLKLIDSLKTLFGLAGKCLVRKLKTGCFFLSSWNF